MLAARPFPRWSYRDFLQDGSGWDSIPYTTTPNTLGAFTETNQRAVIPLDRGFKMASADAQMGSVGSFMPRPVFLNCDPYIGVGQYWPGCLVSPNWFDNLDFYGDMYFDAIPDMTGSIQKAVDAAAAAGGGIVELPSGVIRIKGDIGVTVGGAGVWIRGKGWEPFEAGGPYDPPRRGKNGTYIVSDYRFSSTSGYWGGFPSRGFSVFKVSTVAANCRITDMAFLIPRTRPGTTTPFAAFSNAPACIETLGPSQNTSSFERLLFWNVTCGIKLGDDNAYFSTVGQAGYAGNATVRDCVFATLGRGVDARYIKGTVTIDNCSFDASVLTLGSSEAKALKSGGVIGVFLAGVEKCLMTNLQFSNIWSGLYMDYAQVATTGLSVSTPPKLTQLLGAAASSCASNAVFMNGGNVMRISGLTAQGPATTTDAITYAIGIGAGSAAVDLDNSYFTDWEGPAILLSGNTNDLRLGSRVHINNTNTKPPIFGSPNPAPAILFAGGTTANKLSVSTNCRFTNLNGGIFADYQAGTTGIITIY